ENGSYVDAHRRGEGDMAIDAMIKAAQAQFPGYRLRLVSGIESHNGHVRFSWAAGGAPEAPLYLGGQTSRLLAEMAGSTRWSVSPTPHRPLSEERRPSLSATRRNCRKWSAARCAKSRRFRSRSRRVNSSRPRSMLTAWIRSFTAFWPRRFPALSGSKTSKLS